MKQTIAQPNARQVIGTCGECRYWSRYEDDDDTDDLVGECRRMPPTFTVVLVPEPKTPVVAGSSDWPTVADDGWCGEFAPKYGRQ